MFEKLVNSDNIVWRGFGMFADLMILNLLFIACSLPIVTIGASVTALYTVTLKMIEKNERYIAKEFLSAFKSNFKQSTIIWLIMLVFGALLIGDFIIINYMEASFVETLRHVFIFLALCYGMILSYVFPLQSKFENTMLNTILNAAKMSIAHFIPWTILIVLINIAPVLFVLLDLETLVNCILPIMVTFGFVAIAYINSMIFRRVFAHYIPKEVEE